MISNGEGWHFIALKKLLALLREIISKHHGDFYSLICLHSFKAECKVESHKKVWKNEDFCNITIPSEVSKILEFNEFQKSP